MNLYNSQTYLNDIDYVIENTSILEELKDRSVLITGATGLIGSAIIDLLLRYNENTHDKITVFAAGRSEDRIRGRFSRYRNDEFLKFVLYDATKVNSLNFHVDYIIHGASNSAPKDIQGHAVDTMLDNFMALHELLMFAARKNVNSTLFISSSEVYGKKESLEPYKEDQYGFVDILNPRSSYSSGKRAGETLCACFSAEKKVKTVIVRPGHIYGPTAKITDSHVSSLFAFDAANGKDLVLKSSGSQIRSYCYSLDAATAILTVLLKGNTSNAYNISNPNSVINIRNMAELIADAGNVKITVGEASETEKLGFNPMQNSSLNSEKLQALGWNGLFDAETGFGHTVKILVESKEKNER